MRILLVLVAALAIAACSAAPGTGGSPGDPPAPTPAAGSYVDVGTGQLAEMLAAKDFTFVNVHIPYEGEIAPTDLFIPFDEVGARLDELPAKDAKIVLYCRSGSMSETAARTLVAAGYTNVWNLAGGMIAWRADGREVLELPQP